MRSVKRQLRPGPYDPSIWKHAARGIRSLRSAESGFLWSHLPYSFYAELRILSGVP